MKTLEESIAGAMDSGGNIAVLPFLPYILQDFWEIGTPAEIVIGLVRKHCTDYSSLNVLDLGCGKGAVCVKLAEALRCRCCGMDGIPEFIEYADQKAREYGVDALCRFEAGDIREKINGAGRYDVIILGAVGQVFGDYYATLTTLTGHLKDEGIIIINDAYIDDSAAFEHPGVLPRREILAQMGRAGMELADESEEDTNAYAEEFDNMQNRCRELMVQYPEKTALFEHFLKTQACEYDALENNITGVIMVVKRI